MKTKSNIIKEALSWYGTPFGPGAIKGKSCSCVGLLAGISRNMGLKEISEEFFRYEHHIRPENSTMLVLKLRKVLSLGDTKNIDPLDVIVTKTKKNWHHVGLMLLNNNVIEADETLGKVIYSRLNKVPSLVLKVPEIQSWPD